MDNAAQPFGRNAPAAASIVIPKAVFYGALVTITLAMPMTLWGVAWYMSGQNAAGTRVVEDLALFRKQSDQKLDEISKDTKATNVEIQAMRERLIKVESALTYLATTAQPPVVRR